MGFANLPNLGNANVLFLEEATLNTFNATGTYEQVALAQMTFSVNEQEDIVKEAGRPVPTDVGHHSAHITGEVTLPFRFGRDCTDLLSLAMRNTILPAEVAITPTVSFILLAAGSHLDGDTGPQLQVIGSNNAFDGLFAATDQADSRQQLLRITDAATVGNDSGNSTAGRGPILVKTGNGRDVAADTHLDLDGRLFQTADGWGGDFTGDTADAIGLDAGAMLGLRLSRPSGNDTHSLVIRYDDIATPQYFTLTGVTYGGPSLAFNGRGQISWKIPYVAAGWTNVSVTNPAAGGALQDTVNTYRQPIRGGAEVTKILLATDSALVALEGSEVTDLVWGAPSPPIMVHDTHGQAGPSGYILPGYDPVVGFSYQIANAAAPKAVTLQGWATAHTPLLMIVEFTDSLGNLIYLKAEQAVPGSSILPQVGGGDGPARGTFAAKCEELSRQDLAWTYHQFAA